MRRISLLLPQPQTWFDYRKLFVLTFCILAFAGTVRGQSLVVVSGGNTVSQGGTASINTIPNMPNLVLSVNGGTSCDVFSYQISITYTDQAATPATTGTGVTFGNSNVEGDLSDSVNWTSHFEGGNATISWQFDGVSEPSFSFEVNGINPPNSAVDSYLASGGGPWFAQNLVAWESHAHPAEQYHQFDSNGNPLWGTPDGIGLMQVEPPNRNSGDLSFWAWSQNIADGLHLLSQLLASDGPTTGPHTNWTNQYNNMITDTSKHGTNPVPASWPSDCQNHVNGAVCGGFNLPSPTFYCNFFSTANNSSRNGFGDANWIHAYNGSYFVDWVPIGTLPDFPNGGWEYDRQGPNNGYVYDVCTSQPL
jgi:hypothetical protein